MANLDGLGAATLKRPAAMRFIMIAVLIDMMSIGLMIPVLPHLVGLFTQSKADQAFWFGAVSFSFGIANFFWLTDPRRPVRPFWSPSCFADRVFGARLQLLHDRCGHKSVDAGLDTAHWRCDASQHCGGKCLCR